MPEGTETETAAELQDQTPASTPGLKAMAEKFDTLVRENQPDAGKGGGDKGGDKGGEAPAGDAAAAEAAAAKAKAAETAKTAPKPEDDPNFVPPSIKSPKAAEDFKLIKSRALAAESKIAEIEKAHAAKLKEFEDKLKVTSKVDPKEIETLKGEVAKYRGIVETVTLEMDPNFQAKYENRAKTIIDGLRTVITEQKLKQLGELFQMPDGPAKQQQLLALADDLDDLQKVELMQANRDFRTMFHERNAELQKSREKLAELQKGKQAEAEQLKQQRTQAFDAVAERVKGKEAGMFLFQLKDGDEAWNKGVEERVAMAKHIFEGNFENDSERADAAFWAASAEAILKDAIAAKAEIAELTARIQKISGASPQIKGGGQPKGGEDTKPKTFTERVKAGVDAARGG